MLSLIYGLVLSFGLVFCSYQAAAFPQNQNNNGQFSVQLNAESRHEEFANGAYILDWSVDVESSTIYFNVSVKTLGYVGFGISPSGAGMTGADIVIGGVFENGTSYFGVSNIR